MRAFCPEYLERIEPERVDIGDFAFIENTHATELAEIESRGAACLAKQLTQDVCGNETSQGLANIITYGEKRILEDGSIEKLIGCKGCGAICAIMETPMESSAECRSESDSNVVASIAEAPQPNPWTELGNFSDCRVGTVRVPEIADSLTRPHGLSEDHRLFAKLLSRLTEYLP